MSIRDNVAIKVLSHNTHPVSVATNVREYLFEPSKDSVPTYFPMSFGEIEYINSHTPAFRNGMLTFEDSDKERYYDVLKIFNWRDILFVDEIRDILENPSIDGLQRIVNIRDAMTIQRVRGEMTYMINSGVYDVSQRVIDIVNRRYNEISHNKFNSDIILTPKSIPAPTPDYAELQKQIAMLQSEMAKMAANQPIISEDENEAVEDVELIAESPAEQPKKAAGRKKRS